VTRKKDGPKKKFRQTGDEGFHESGTRGRKERIFFVAKSPKKVTNLGKKEVLQVGLAAV